MSKETKYIFVTGGVLSSLGKGIAAASIATLLKNVGYKVSMLKADPYINVDPGTMSPLEHGAAADEDGGDVDAGGGHEKSGDVLVAVGDHDEAIEAMREDHRLGRVGDEVTRDERVLHAGVTHGDAVADGDGREHDGSAASHGNAQFHRVHDLIQVHMAGDDLVVGADHGNQGPLLLLFRQAKSVIQAPVGGVLGAVHDLVFHHHRIFLLS